MSLKKNYTRFQLGERDEIVGNVKFHKDFYSLHLKNERDIIVWLPPSYDSSNKKYPVLYMHDGQNLFNPKTAFAGYDWKVDELTTSLIKKNLINELIVIGINSTKDRIDEYNLFTDKGKGYAHFLISELKRFVDENYRTKPDRKNTAIMGSSLGGLISFQMICEYTDVFGKAGCMSNSFWVNERKIIEQVSSTKNFPRNIKIYLDCGSSEKELIGDNKKMCLLLKSIGFEQGKNLYCHFVRGGKHSEIDWSKRLHRPLIYLFGKNKENKPYDNRSK